MEQPPRRVSSPPEGDPGPRDQSRLAAELAREEVRLRALTAEQSGVLAHIARLRAQLESFPGEGSPGAGVSETHAFVDRATSPAALSPSPSPGSVSPAAPRTPAAKIALFRGLFRGRDDVYPRLWENARTQRRGYSPACGNEWLQGVCEKPRVKCGECSNQAFLPVTDTVLLDHLQGRHVVGVYPMLRDETCWLLAADFDREGWMEDVTAFRETCRDVGIEGAVERSRSGNGAHVWLFFKAPLPAPLARKLGTCLLTRTLARRHQLGMASYDRLFPNQDTLPRGGFGNLIALPLQHEPRQQGNTVFLDSSLVPFEDQWAFLASVERLDRAVVERIIEESRARGQVLGVRLPPTDSDLGVDAGSEDPSPTSAGLLSPDGETTPGTSAPGNRERNILLEEPAPAVVNATLAERLFVKKDGVPAALLDQVQRLAAFQNPEFYKRQALRLSTALTPRVISCAEDLPEHLALPRGCRGDLEALLAQVGSRLEVDDQRTEGEPLDVEFRGQLTPLQEKASSALLPYDHGIVVAPPGAGKTVLGASLIAKRGRNTLVLVHRRLLLEQWRAQLGVFLGLDPGEIGRIGAGKDDSNGRIDVATIQSLIRRGEVDARVGGYGHVVVDECHHVPAVSFERVLAAVKGKYLTGLTATPQRRDGHHPILEMQLGPVRFEAGPMARATARARRGSGEFVRKLIVRETGFRWGRPEPAPSIQELYSALTSDPARNRQLVDEVIQAVDEGRSPIVLTERKDHLAALAREIGRAVRNVVILQGGMSALERRRAAESLATVPEGEERLLLATGRFIGEGFDDVRLDTLFLALPIAWKGTLVQYAGRLHRQRSSKTEVRIIDYVDAEVPVLARMFGKRLRGYRAMGYEREG